MEFFWTPQDDSSVLSRMTSPCVQSPFLKALELEIFLATHYQSPSLIVTKFFIFPERPDLDLRLTHL